MDRQATAKRGHRQRSERDQSIFDFSAGEVSGGKASQANPDGHRSLQQASMRRIEMENILSVQENIELQESGHKEKVGVSRNRKPKNAVAADQLHGRPDVDQRGEMELFAGIGSRNFAYAKAAHQTDNRERKKNRAGIHLSSSEFRGKDRSADTSCDNSEESP